MPRYFFNVHLEGSIITDSEGQEFHDADEAWEATKAMAQDLMATEFSRPVNWSSSHIEVKDDKGVVILEFPFLEAVEFTKQPN